MGRFLSLDIDARAWPDVGERDRVIGRAQRHFPGLRPCGFHSPYEAAAWAVLSQRVQLRQAAWLKQELVDRHGEAGAFPEPNVLRGLALDLPGRKQEYLHAVAEAALDGVLDGASLRAQETASALGQIRGITGLGPFSAELVLIRGANAPDLVPQHEKRLAAEVAERYGTDRALSAVSDGWRPFRSWASVHLRVLREFRAQGPGDPLP